MNDSIFVDAYTRYGWTEECYVDFEKGQICLKAHDARIPRTLIADIGSLYGVERTLLRNRR